jgi:hypothetical protein
LGFGIRFSSVALFVLLGVGSREGHPQVEVPAAVRRPRPNKLAIPNENKPYRSQIRAGLL